jgi:hypothetical protein
MRSKIFAVLQRMICDFLNNLLENYDRFFIILLLFVYGRVAEWPIAAVLKTAVGQPTVGSNPTSSVIFPYRTVRVIFDRSLIESGFECSCVPHNTLLCLKRHELDFVDLALE